MENDLPILGVNYIKTSENSK